MVGAERVARLTLCWARMAAVDRGVDFGKKARCVGVQCRRGVGARNGYAGRYLTSVRDAEVAVPVIPFPGDVGCRRDSLEQIHKRNHTPVDLPVVPHAITMASPCGRP